MTYTGRGLLASRTESPGTAEVATESYTYNIEGRQLTASMRAGSRGPQSGTPAAVASKGVLIRMATVPSSTSTTWGRATHTATVSNVTAHSANYKDPIDAPTLGETTTKYDTRAASPPARSG